MLLGSVKATVFIVIISFLQNGIGYIVLTGAVALNDGCHHVLWHILIVCKKLLCVFGQTIASITEGRIIIVCSDTWVKSYTTDNTLGVQTFNLGVCVKLIEIADAKGKVGIGKELYCLSLFHSHKQGVDVFLQSTLMKQCGKGLCCLFHSGNICYTEDGFVL